MMIVYVSPIRYPNQSLDRTAMSAVSGGVADSCVPAVLTVVGQLDR